MKKISIILFVLLIAASQVLAQGGGSDAFSDVRSVGMAKTYTMSSRGVHSIGINPANLAFQQKHKFELKTLFPIPNINVSFGNDFLTMEDVNYFFGGVVDPVTGETVGRDISDPAEKQKFKDLFADGSAMYVDMTLPLFAVSYYVNEKVGSFAFGINDRFGYWMDVPTDLIDLYLEGTTPGKEYDLDDFDFEAWYLREYSISYARDFTKLFRLNKYVKQFNVGVSLKMVQGFVYAGLEQFNTTIDISPNDYALTVNSDIIMNMAISPDFGVKYDFEDDDIDKESNAGPFPEPSGSGFGFDLGFSAQINDAWSVALAITDIGAMTWDTEAVQYTSPYASYTLRDITKEEEIDTLKDVFKGEGQYVGEIETGLPTALRIGASFDVQKQFKWRIPFKAYLDYNQGFNDLPGNSMNPRVSIGMESRPLSWLPLRTGFSFGGRYGFNWGFGLGFDAKFLEFEFATTSLNSLFMGNDAEKVGVAFGSRWKF